MVDRGLSVTDFPSADGNIMNMIDLSILWSDPIAAHPYDTGADICISNWVAFSLIVVAMATAKVVLWS